MRRLLESALGARGEPGDKRAFYSQQEVAEGYDQQRFGGASGARVNAREIATVLGMLPPGGPVLDLACGTGRVAQAIRKRGEKVVGLDFSPAMAEKTASLAVPTVIGDAFTTPFASGSFASAVSLRFAFHWENIEPLVRELARVVAPGGTVIFDTYTWSARSMLPVGAKRWGGVVYPHSPAEVATYAESAGLRIRRMEPCFLFSPYLYRLAPVLLQQTFELVERQLPPQALCRVFWKLTLNDGRS